MKKKKYKYKIGDRIKVRRPHHPHLEHNKHYTILDSCKCSGCGEVTYCIYLDTLPYSNYNGQDVYNECENCGKSLGCDDANHAWPKESDIIDVKECLTENYSIW